MAKHTTYFFSEDARAQADFYVKALGGEILSVMTYGDLPNAEEALKDKVIHLSLVAAGVPFYMCDAAPGEFDPGNSINQSLEFATDAEAYEAFDKLAEGGTVRSPMRQEFWGSLFGQLTDKFGINWMITTESKSDPA